MNLFSKFCRASTAVERAARKVLPAPRCSVLPQCYSSPASPFPLTVRTRTLPRMFPRFREEQKQKTSGANNKRPGERRAPKLMVARRGECKFVSCASREQRCHRDLRPDARTFRGDCNPYEQLANCNKIRLVPQVYTNDFINTRTVRVYGYIHARPYVSSAVCSVGDVFISKIPLPSLRVRKLGDKGEICTPPPFTPTSESLGGTKDIAKTSRGAPQENNVYYDSYLPMDSKRTRQEKGSSTGKLNVGMPFANQRQIIYSPASSPANKELPSACSSEPHLLCEKMLHPSARAGSGTWSTDRLQENVPTGKMRSLGTTRAELLRVSNVQSPLSAKGPELACSVLIGQRVRMGLQTLVHPVFQNSDLLQLKFMLLILPPYAVCRIPDYGMRGPALESQGMSVFVIILLVLHIILVPSLMIEGATVAEWLACSPPTKADRVQFPAGRSNFRMWESCRTMPLVGGFSRGFPVPPPFLSGAVLYSPKPPSSALKTSLLKAAHISSLTLMIDLSTRRRGLPTFYAPKILSKLFAPRSRRSSERILPRRLDSILKQSAVSDAQRTALTFSSPPGHIEFH
ncbi:hypothetical protein PR048_005794 [Dryococelus australis]|uniref:Uncharacterized protein n=1 Tax=Dryococelus australis TaxID=614101 RepID=A0ABQ9I969_9NEOP|nr:hypothetical protein PR048_005794 [Dryococelus australis]